jgi:hypothetical protein
MHSHTYVILFLFATSARPSEPSICIHTYHSYCLSIDRHIHTLHSYTHAACACTYFHMCVCSRKSIHTYVEDPRARLRMRKRCHAQIPPLTQASTTHHPCTNKANRQKRAHTYIHICIHTHTCLRNPLLRRRICKPVQTEVTATLLMAMQNELAACYAVMDLHNMERCVSVMLMYTHAFHVFVYTFIHMCMYVVYVCIYVCIYVCMYLCVGVYVCTWLSCMRARAYCMLLRQASAYQGEALAYILVHPPKNSMNH